MTRCKTDIILKRKDCGYYIAIPHGGKYKITLDLELKDSKHCPVIVEVLLQNIYMKTILSKQITGTERKPHIHLSDSFIWEVPMSKEEHFLSVRLLSENGVNIINGKITVVEKLRLYTRIRG